ncbi:MinD-like ATPase involved in chromosome partitioning or flagellar assembly [Ferrithrix thermotolerans DSM 19514]|uniref:MinD-like ATPase involved in chromosome partitioning or flagellar assembly n=1 Tax=Ferrithrix thermotolerans DSM 19514 TaxID=1121881 RepID=A0A1M4UTF4_9ACTN|nr:MinD-like ATPase involved in chromosome partitioning or flagellar assembly [Ferrithrix thermotolerans DSM 19514]
MPQDRPLDHRSPKVESYASQKTLIACVSEIEYDWITEVFRSVIPLAAHVQVLWIRHESELGDFLSSGVRTFLVFDANEYPSIATHSNTDNYELEIPDTVLQVLDRVRNLVFVTELRQERDQGDEVVELRVQEPKVVFHSSSKKNALGRKSPSAKDTTAPTALEHPVQGGLATVAIVMGPRGSGISTVSSVIATGLAKVGPTALVELTLDCDLAYLHGVDPLAPTLSEYLAQSGNEESTKPLLMIDELTNVAPGFDYCLIPGVWDPKHITLMEQRGIIELIKALRARFSYLVCEVHPYLARPYDYEDLGSPLMADIALSVSSHLTLVTQQDPKWIYAISKILTDLVEKKEAPSSWSIVINRFKDQRAERTRLKRDISQILSLTTLGSRYEGIDAPIHFAKERKGAFPSLLAQDVAGVVSTITALAPKDHTELDDGRESLTPVTLF